MTDPIVRADWAGERVRLVADTTHMSAEFSISLDAAERLQESLRIAIAGARRFDETRSERAGR